MHLHATVRAWQREEDGSYKAEIAGYSLHVVWRPEGSGTRRGFTWRARPAEGEEGRAELTSDEPEEEIEIAMAQAEDAVRRAH